MHTVASKAMHTRTRPHIHMRVEIWIFLPVDQLALFVLSIHYANGIVVIIDNGASSLLLFFSLSLERSMWNAIDSLWPNGEVKNCRFALCSSRRVCIVEL